MKILEVNVDDISFGGVYSFVHNIIENRPVGAIVDIAAIEKFENADNIKELGALGCNVHYVGYVGGKFLKQLYVFRNLKELIAEGGYSAVHIHADVANKLFVSALAAKHAGCKKILLHSHATGVEGNRRFFKRLFHYACRRLLKYLGTDYLACSDIAGRWMFPNVKAENVKVVNNGINLDKFHFSEEKRKAIRLKLGVDRKFVIGHVGRFAYPKNHEYLIDTFKSVCVHDASAVLLLVGEGDLEEKIKAKVVKLGIDDRVIFYGISNNVSELFMAMDVFVLPSRFEGFGIVALEAQAVGLPCVLSDAVPSCVKFSDNVDFLPTTKEAVGDWVCAIEKYKQEKRSDCINVIKEAGFSIKDTVAHLWHLYCK